MRMGTTTNRNSQDVCTTQTAGNENVVGDIFTSRTFIKRSSGSSKTLLMEKRVHFSSKKRVKKIPHLNDMPEQIIKDCWFTSQCLEEITASQLSLTYMMKTDGQIIDEEKESTRGLESSTPEGACGKYQRNQSAYDAVMEEQERQWSENIENSGMIARLYQMSSKESTRIAILNARKDEVAVQDYLHSTRMEEWRRQSLMCKSMKHNAWFTYRSRARPVRDIVRDHRNFVRAA